jgi:hypothetical protein
VESFSDLDVRIRILDRQLLEELQFVLSQHEGCLFEGG